MDICSWSYVQDSLVHVIYADLYEALTVADILKNWFTVIVLKCVCLCIYSCRKISEKHGFVYIVEYE